jgi:hypothetical protein
MPTRSMSDKITIHENSHAAMVLQQYMDTNGIIKPVEVDKQCLVSDGMTSSILRGKTPYPTVRFMTRMAHGIGMPLDDLLGDGMPEVPDVPVVTLTTDDGAQTTLPLDNVAATVQHASPVAPLVSHLIQEWGAEAFQKKLDSFFLQLAYLGKQPEHIFFSSTGVHTYRDKEHFAVLVLVRQGA